MKTIQLVGGPFLPGTRLQVPDDVASFSITFFGSYDSTKSDQHRSHRLAHYIQTQEIPEQFDYVPQHKSIE